MAGTDRATRGTKPVAKAFLDALATIPKGPSLNKRIAVWESECEGADEGFRRETG